MSEDTNAKNVSGTEKMEVDSTVPDAGAKSNESGTSATAEKVEIEEDSQASSNAGGKDTETSAGDVDTKVEPETGADVEEVPVVIPDFLSMITPEKSIPTSSIKRVAKVDKSVKSASEDAMYLIAKAAECFVTELAYMTAVEAKKNSTRKVVQYEDVRAAYETANSNGKDWRFLEGILPPCKKRKTK